ncbi:uncharacterized protein LOC101237735 [Hydra vulgaris]|uniref:uncharacterized protein LOC101237735 n=1 Tax=Hydra vulgaris TaxID=6087 RepID=UPI0032EA1F81
MENEKSPLLENEYSESLIDPNRGHSTNSCSYDFHILNKEFPDIFYKKQVYLNNQSIQRIDNGFLSFFLVFGSPEARNSVNCITVKVQHAFKQHKDVIIKHDQSFMDKNKVCIKIDLNSVYVVDNFKVFELDKNCNDDQRKSFFLDVEVKFSNNKTYKQSTQRFCLVGGKGRLNSSSSAAIVSPYSTPTQHYAEFGYSTSSREVRCTQLSPLLQSDEFTTSCTSSREATFSQLLFPLLQSDEFTTSCTSSRGAIFSQFSSPLLHSYEFTSSCKIFVYIYIYIYI